jgi:stearoyl-CoA desaturase (Delta-9 desaturase)
VHVCRDYNGSMLYGLLCIGVFLTFYTINMIYTSVFYHRAMTHRALTLRRSVRRFVVATGIWVTGIDPKTWVCMHRMHHRFSDTKEDPHSPVHRGFFRLILVQLKSYGKTMEGLLRGDRRYTDQVRDLDFKVSWLHRHGVWFLPHLSQTLIAIAIGFAFNAWLVAFCFWLGLMSHPIQGWLVNAFGHQIGYRNYATHDNSKNNWWVSLIVMGEGLQNNHHRHPTSAHFAYKWYEVDFGYFLCCALWLLGIVDFPRTRHYNR